MSGARHDGGLPEGARAAWARVLPVLLAVLWAGVAFRTPARAADVQVMADRALVEVGERVGLQVVVSGVQQSEVPAFPAIPGARVRYLGPMTQMESFNGQSSVRSTHRYLLWADATNDLVIPSFPVRAGTQALQTAPLRIRVTPREEHEDPAWLKLVVPPGTRVVGESFPVELQLYYQAIRDADAPRFNLDGFLLGRGQQPTQGATPRGNETWSVVTWRFAVTATKAGNLTVGPAEMDASVFTGPRTLARVTLKSRPEAVAVVEPPRVGRPAGFLGAVGRFTLTGAVTSREVSVGDPVTLHLVVSGRGNLDRLALGPIPDSRDFRAYPGTNRLESSDPLAFEGRKVFEYVLVPEQAGTLRVPVPPLVYYDPERRAYATAAAPELVLKVRGQAAAQVVPQLAGANAGDTAKAAATGAAVWKPARTPRPWAGTGWGTRPVVALAGMLPWIGLAAVGLGGWAVRRRRAASARTPEQAWAAELAALRGVLRSGDAALDPAVQAVRIAVALRLGRPPGTVDPDVLGRAGRDGALDATLAAEAGAFLAAADDFRFGGGQGDVAGLVRTAVSLLERLEGGGR